MEIRGVITGDIISSMTVKTEWRKMLLDTIQEIAHELEVLSSLRLEFFRGDSFQIIVENPIEAIKIIVLLRAGLKSRTPKESEQLWDARTALGIGSITYASEKVVVSDGEAFHFSGWEFDELGKRKLSVRTPWKEVNDELKVSTAFADDIITGWSASQAEVIYQTLLNKEFFQKEIAIQLNKSAQNVSKLLIAGKESLIRLYLERFAQIISKHII